MTPASITPRSCSPRRTRLPRAALVSTLLLLLTSLFATAAGMRPVGAVGNANFKAVVVTTTSTSAQCVDSGHSLDLTQFPMGHREMTNVKTSNFRTDFWAFDDDQKVGDPECTPDYISNTCGDVAWGYKYIDISTPGTHTFSLHAYGIQNSLDVTAEGYVVVTYY